MICLIAASSFGQEAKNIEASKLLHESISNKDWNFEDGPEFCNKNKFIKAIENGGDLNTQSDIYHQKKVHQNVLNRAISYRCLDIVNLILNDYLPQTESEVYQLVNDPNRALNTTPLKRTVNKGLTSLFTKMISDYPVEIDIPMLFRKIARQNELEMAKVLVNSSAVKSLDQIYRALVISVQKEYIEMLGLLLDNDIKRLNKRNSLKLKEKASLKSQEIKELLDLI